MLSTSRCNFIVALLALASWPAVAQPSSSAKAFATPEAAVDGLIQAVRAPTVQPLVDILGKDVLDSIPADERNSDAVRRAAGERLASKKVEIVYDDAAKTRARAVVGDEKFPVPAPLVRTAAGWQFDGKAAIAEMRERRAGVNEANALEALRSFARAQHVYYQRDRNGDGVLEYAQRIRGNPGELDGLVNGEPRDVPGPAVSLLNEAFARAEGKPGDPSLQPGGGYGYRVLTAQGPNAQGGAKNYVINGRMTEGYAIVAWPIKPGESGLSTFVMSYHGRIFEREIGAQTADVVGKMTAFDPDKDWTEVDD